MNNVTEELKIFECEKHGSYEGKMLKISIFGKEKELYPECPICEKEKIEKEEQERKEHEELIEAQEEENQKEKFKEMNIGEKFWNESFDTFDPYTEELKNHLETCKAFTENHKGRMLVMIGKNGNGKDHLASSILKIIGGYMYSVFELELLLRQSYTGKISEWDIYEKLCKAPLLVINEIGKHKPGDWEMNFMSYIINKRYENIKPVILVSNTHLKDNCPDRGCDNCLEHYIGKDVISRIIEGGEIMLFTGDDYRAKKRQMGRG